MRRLGLLIKAITIGIAIKRVIIGGIITGAVNCYLFDYINIVCKQIKKYKFDRLRKLYTWSRSGFENAYLLNKGYINITSLLCKF